MKIIFCISYLNIPITLTISEQCTTPFLIATCNEKIYQFFATFYPKECLIYFEKAKPEIAKNPYKIITNAAFNQRLKRKLEVQFGSYDHCDIYFFLYAFGESAAYVVKYLSQRNRIFYIPAVKVETAPLSPFSLYRLVIIIAKKIAFGLDVYAINDGSRDIFPYSESYFRSLNCTKLDMVVDYKIIQKFQQQNLNIANKKILILTGMIVEPGLVEEAHYSYMIDKLIQALPAGQVAIKLHPHASRKYSAEINLPELAKEWPANMLIHVFPVIIGYHSASIYEAANAGRVAISLLDLIDPVNPSVKAHTKTYLNNHLTAKNPIHFPRTIDALLERINYVD